MLAVLWPHRVEILLLGLYWWGAVVVVVTQVPITLQLELVESAMPLAVAAVVRGSPSIQLVLGALAASAVVGPAVPPAPVAGAVRAVAQLEMLPLAQVYKTPPWELGSRRASQAPA